MRDSHLATTADGEASRRRAARTTYSTSDGEAAASHTNCVGVAAGTSRRLRQASRTSCRAGYRAGRSASKPRRGQGMDEDAQTGGAAAWAHLA
jgi:hypothetical protein